MLILCRFMRVVILVLLFVSSLVLRAHNNVYAGVQHNSICYARIQNTGKTEKPASVNAVHGLTIAKNADLNEKNDEFFSIENEDDIPVFARKYVLLGDSAITVVYTSILNCFYYYLKAHLLFCKHLSFTSANKYILQRVLRI